MNAHRLPALLLWLDVPPAAQDSVFTQVRLVHDLNTETWGHFPAWKDTRSARGGIGRDGHLEVMLLGQGTVRPGDEVLPTIPVTVFTPWPSGAV